MENREIKFRAWLKEENKMAFYISNFKGDGGIWEISVPFDESGIHTYRIDRNEAILMQFTGLKDKNGKEIYEGDIVQCSGDIGKTVVEYVSDMFHLKSLKYKNLSEGNLRLATLAPSSEIIGNIYENKDLLKV